MTVFQLDRNFKIILNPEAVKLVPELRSLDEKELEYVILVVDYIDSPFRKKGVDERKLMAKRKVYGDTKKNVETKKLINAMDGYKSLVFDIRRETIDVYKKKIKRLQRETLTESDDYNLELRRLKGINESIDFLQGRIIKMERDLDADEKESNMVLKGNRRLSYIEIWQERQKRYSEYKEGI
jgi:hypothetical protein